MKNQIHTLPVLDALREPEHCPFCVMRRELERKAVGFIMGPAYMEDDVRMETNRAGFCAAHLKQMYGGQNRLGLALMLHTFTQRLNRDIAGDMDAPAGKKTPGRAARLTARLTAQTASCYLCARVEDTFTRYIDTFFMLWLTNREAAALVKAVPGYCLPHFTAVLAAAEENIPKQRLTDFWDAVIPAQRLFMERMETDLEWFTLKFDYRNINEPWKNAKDALPRAMALLGGGAADKPAGEV